MKLLFKKLTVNQFSRILLFGAAMIMCICLSYNNSYAQFGLKDALKKKAGKVIKEKLIEKTDEKTQSYDTLSFNYAIAFLDKSELYRNKQDGESLVKFGNYMLDDESDKTDLEILRESYDLAAISYSAGSYFIAETYLKQIANKNIKIGPEGQPIWLKSLGLLGVIYNNTGRYSESEEYTSKALTGWKEFQGQESIGYFAELNNLAVLRMNQGDYLNAEKYMQQLNEPLLKLKGEQELPFAIYLNNKAILNQYMGRSAEALRNIKECIAFSVDHLSSSNSTYLQFMTNQAIIEQEEGRLAEAENTFKKVVDLQSSFLKLGKKAENNLAHTQANLAALYMRKNEIEKAEELLQKAFETLEKNKGIDDIQTATVQADLGNLYRFTEQFDKAKALLTDALDTRKRKLPSEHPSIIKNKEDLAIYYWQIGNIDQATIYYKEVLEVSIKFIETYFNALSEAEKTNYWESLKPRFYRFYNFAMDHQQEKKELLSLMIKYRLTTKGILLSASTAMQNEMSNHADSEVRDLYLGWTSIKQQLANIYSLSQEDIKEQNINIDSLERVANNKEKELTLLSGAFKNSFQNKNLDPGKLISQLDQNEALVEIIQMPLFDKKLSDKSRYALLIFKKSLPGPKLLEIKNGEELEGRYFAYYNNVVKQKMVDQYSYQKYFQPFEEELKSRSKVYISPDGIYNQLNLSTLKQANGKYLIEDHTFIYLGHPNDLISYKKDRPNNNNTAFLLGDPDYGNSGIEQLPGTQKELNAISLYLRSSLKVQQYTQQNASEDNLKQVSSPKILHLASHGFFLEDRQLSDNLLGVHVQYLQQNPLLRSGLLLTGARTGQASSGSGQSFNKANNGIFTAYEAINLDLKNTDMVVLSACETGKGDVKAGEGVYGLQRAFIIAGAKSIIMSMWKVDDEATRQLMSLFYKYRNQKIPLSSAFRAAQLDLMKSYKDPYYWGAFMMFSQ